MRKILTVNPEIVVGVGLVGDSLLLDSFLRRSKRDLSTVFPEAVERGVIHRDLRTLHDLYTGAGELQPIFDREIKRLSQQRQHMEFLSSRDVVVWYDKHLAVLCDAASNLRDSEMLLSVYWNLRVSQRSGALLPRCRLVLPHQGLMETIWRMEDLLNLAYYRRKFNQS